MVVTPPRTCQAALRCSSSRNPLLLSRSAPHHPRHHISSSRCASQRSFSTTHSASFHRSRPRPRTSEEGFGSRLRNALKDTKVQWYPIPIGLGVGFLGFVQFYKSQAREKERLEREASEAGEPGAASPRKRPRVRPEGPWQVQIMSTLPLKAMSRLWGKFNSINIPYYFRVPGFKLYSYIFGVNLEEVAEPDLHVYPNLASFFYRTLKPGARPLDPDPAALLSPSDGRVLQFGKIEGGDIEQVKGMTYTVDALLGKQHGSSTGATSGLPGLPGVLSSEDPSHTRSHSDEELVQQDEEFARVNGISYTLPALLSGGPSESHTPSPSDSQTPSDQTARPSSPGAVSQVQADLESKPWYANLTGSSSPTSLYYAVIYLAPGDYHRFHSPANWVVSQRRHFAGELYSVSPYLQRTLPGLFTLNERVALLGRWRHGFFAYVPVGATNVGSIVVNFDRELRTNSLLTDTAADRAAEEASRRGEVYSGYAEATYKGASRVLGGHALRRGEEMGGFKLGSTIVLVFEAPVGAAAQEEKNNQGGEKAVVASSTGVGGRGFTWEVEKGQTVKMGQALGRVVE